MKKSKPLSWIFRFFPIMAFCFFIAGLPIKAGAYYIVNIPVTVTVDYDNSMRAIELFNEERVKMGRDPLTIDSTLMAEALQRAAEVSTWCTHNRPAGDLATYDLTYDQENLGQASTTNAATLVNGMKSSSGHWSNAMASIHKCTAIAIVNSGSSNFIVQLFGDREGDGSGYRTGKETITRTVEFSNGNLNGNFCKGRITNVTYGNPDTTPIYINSWYSTSGIMGYVADKSEGYIMPDGMYTCSSSDTSIFTVDNKGTVYPKKVGTANMTVTLKDHPDISATFPITVDSYDIGSYKSWENPKSISSKDVNEGQYWDWRYLKEAFFYTGSAIEPKIELMFNDTVLTEGTDYDVSYANNVNVGKATLYYKGKGNFTGTYWADFEIREKIADTGTNTSTGTVNTVTAGGGSSSSWDTGSWIAEPSPKRNCTVTLPKTVYTYTGKARKPSVKVVLNGLLLKPGEYSVTYKNNVKPGLATVTVKGKGMYASTVPAQKISFVIVPKKMGTPAVKASGSGKLKVSWKKDKLASGYQIQASTSKKFKSGVKSYTCKVSTSSKTLKLSKKKTYYVRIRAYKTVNGTKKYGAWSKVKKIKTK